MQEKDPAPRLSRPRPLWNLHCWQMFRTANSATSGRINLCTTTRRTCREREVRSFLKKLLKILSWLKLGRVSVFFPLSGCLDALRFVANWPSVSSAPRRFGCSRWPLRCLLQPLVVAAASARALMAPPRLTPDSPLACSRSG